MGNKQSTPSVTNGIGEKWKRFGSKGSRSSSQKSDRGHGSTAAEKVQKAPVQEPVPESRSAASAVVGAVQLDGTPTSSTATTTARQNDPPMAPTQSTTVPCQYRTGKTLGSGTYAIVKEAVHIKTGKYYACKVINKKLMEGREYMVRNEIAVLKRVSKGHQNIVTLHDYFETTHNLYLCFDLCTGGELFDRICAKGNYFEADAANLVRTIMAAVAYIHDCGIVHRDLKPENLLFRDKREDADIMIADFGLSRVMEEEKLQLLTEICGTPGYMAPEIFKKSGHGKPVDIWAMGVITYFLLCGYTPFDRDTQEQEMQAIIAGDYAFEPAEYWQNVSEVAKSFVTECLTIDPRNRPTAKEALQHKWLASEQPHFVADTMGEPKDLLPAIQKGFNAKKTFRKAVLGMMAMKRMSMLSHQNLSPRAQELASEVKRYMEDSEKEVIDADQSIMHHFDQGSSHSDEDLDKMPQKLKDTDDAKEGGSSPSSPPIAQMQEASLSESKLPQKKSES